MTKQILLLAGVALLTFIAYFSYHYLGDQSDGREVPAELESSAGAEPSVEMTDIPSRPPIGLMQPLPDEEAGAPGEKIALINLTVLEADDPVSLFIPQEGVTYNGVVEETAVADSGSRSLIGMFDVEGVGYRFVFTVGEKFTFGTLHTPAGRYQLQSEAGIGRLIASTNLPKQHSSVVPDYVMPKSPTRQ